MLLIIAVLASVMLDIAYYRKFPSRRWELAVFIALEVGLAASIIVDFRQATSSISLAILICLSLEARMSGLASLLRRPH